MINETITMNDLCTKFKAALEEKFGWKILNLEEDAEGFEFRFQVDVPESGLFWASGLFEELPDNSVPVRGLSIDGFGKGRVWCSMSVQNAVSNFNLIDEAPFLDRLHAFFYDLYKDVLEIVSVDIDEDSTPDNPSAIVLAKLLPGKTFENFRSLNIVSIEEGILKLDVEDFDLDLFPKEEE